MDKRYDLLNSREAVDYLEVSVHKFKKMIKEGALVPYSQVEGRYGKPAFLFTPEQLLEAKKQLISEKYQYKYA